MFGNNYIGNIIIIVFGITTDECRRYKIKISKRSILARVDTNTNRHILKGQNQTLFYGRRKERYKKLFPFLWERTRKRTSNSIFTMCNGLVLLKRRSLHYSNPSYDMFVRNSMSKVNYLISFISNTFLVLIKWSWIKTLCLKQSIFCKSGP